MDHLLAADVLLGDQAAVPLSIGGSYSNMVNSVFYLASRIVDKLWQGKTESHVRTDTLPFLKCIFLKFIH